MPGLIATLGLDDANYRKKLVEARVAAKITGNAVANELRNPGGGVGIGRGSALNELLVLFREIGRGNWTRVPGSLTILTQRLGILKYILNPITGGIVALAAAFGYAAYRINKAATETSNAKTQFSLLNLSLEKQIDLTQKASEEARKYSEWLSKVGQHEETDAQKINQRLEAMREEFAWQQKLAELKRQTPVEKQQAEIGEQRKEKAFIDGEIARLQKQLEERKKLAGQAETLLEEKDFKAGVEKREEEVKKLQAAAKEIEKLNGAGPGGFSRSISDLMLSPEILLGQVMNGRKGVRDVLNRFNSQDITNPNAKPQDIEVNGVKVVASMNDVTAKLATALPALTKLQDEQAKRESAAKDSQKLVDETDKSLEELQKEADKLAEALALNAKYGAEAASLEKQKQQDLIGPLNAAQRVGAYTMPGQVAMLDVAKKSEAHLAAIRGVITKTDKVGGTHW